MNEEEEDKLDVAQVSFIKMAKVAVATAIIRSKPENMTGQEYAATLYQRIQSSSNLWKEKCKELELELIRTKSSLISQSKNPSDETSADPHCSCASRIPSCISFTPPSSSETLQNYKSKTPVSCDRIVESHAEFLASVSRLKMTKKYFEKISDEDHEYECENVNELVEIARTMEKQIPQSVAKIFSMIRSINKSKKLILTQRTLFYSLESVIKVFSSIEEYILTFNNEDNESLIAIAGNIVGDIHNLAMELQTGIMQSEEINENEIQEFRCNILIFLSNYPRFRSAVLKQIVAGISDVALQLKVCVKDGKDSDVYVHLHENVGYLFKTMEGILCQYLGNSRHQQTGEVFMPETQGGNCVDSQPLTEDNVDGHKENLQTIPDPLYVPVTTDENRKNSVQNENFKHILAENDFNFFPEILFRFQLLLEDSVLTTSDQFPLFSFHVWRIFDLIKKCE